MSFSNSGYSNHLRQTANESCRVVHDEEERQELQELLARLGNAWSPSSGVEGTASTHPYPELQDVDMDADPILFEGDYFGVYDPAFLEPDTPRAICGQSCAHDVHDNNNADDANTGIIPIWASPADSLLDSDESEEDNDADKFNVIAWHDTPQTDPICLEDASLDDGSSDLDPSFASAANSDSVGVQHRPPTAETLNSHPQGQTPAEPLISESSRQEAEDNLQRVGGHKTFVVPFPGGKAGAPLSTNIDHAATYEGYGAEGAMPLSKVSPYWPFTSKLDWEVAQWAKKRGPGSTSLTELLQIETVVERLGLSYSTSRELNNIIDRRMSAGRPPFERHEIDVAGEIFEVYYRDVIACVRALFGDPDLASQLLVAPERHYADEDNTVRVYFDMNTGQWWWTVQKALERMKEGATVIPIIISSDKTQLTLIGNKTAYPVYMTIGNLPKDVRSKPSRNGQILLAYLPTSKLEHITNQAARRRMLANLYHACMRRVLEPLQSAGADGLRMASGDGVIRRGHPIFAVHVGDYPEQLLVTGCKNGECPKCPIARTEIGAEMDGHRPLRDLGQVLDALSALDEGPRAYTNACREAGIKPLYHPFWEDLPYTNIYHAITPDLLHQLYQGVVKHLVSWVREAYSADELDARCARLPPNHSLRHFARGISKLSRVTGSEHQDICRILLGLVIGLPLRNGASSVRLVRATRALLDFLYLAQYPAHTSETLTLLENALRAFHENKGIFVDLGIREHFKLPKLHFLDHYRRCIELYGTTDNYDTQYSERLHIDFTKNAYRATNRKDELSQMTVWLERREKIDRHAAYIRWCLRSVVPTVQSSPAALVPPPPPSRSRGGRPYAGTSLARRPRLEMTRHPSVKAVSFDDIVDAYGATYFRDALARFVIERCDFTSALSPAEIERKSAGVYFTFRKVPVFHRIKIWNDDPQDILSTLPQVGDNIHVQPMRKNKHGNEVPARFDTVLVNTGTGGPTGVLADGLAQGYRVAQVRVVFKIPKNALAVLFPDARIARPQHLAYVECYLDRFGVEHV
ncbi:hypothetical protein BN946_scf184766.g44 [Trametes cinnabarina]|uniref:Uncharacterized protein n=1 Tax=Pycnoporus cinnabarinus TaxID=5643 RepID=A0A060SC23_PYCCI|nr:hypothetical protein BN946_scf184766.g44 [Trametes cinnabarina]